MLTATIQQNNKYHKRNAMPLNEGAHVYALKVVFEV
tara:strand:- start:698 stop:805 length:108 start_codon:yes stop_codon:yes gene_type:complete